MDRTLFSSTLRVCKHSSELLSEGAITTPNNEFIDAAIINQFVANPEEYISYFVKYSLSPRLEIIERDSILDEIEKKYYINIMKLVLHFNFLENSFVDEMTRLHVIIKTEDDTTKFTI